MAEQSMSSPEASDKGELYPAKDMGRMEDLPSRGVQTLSEPGVRTHGASAVSDEAYWSGHVLGAVMVLVALVFIVFGRGPRKSHAMPKLWEQKQSYAAERKSGG